MAAKKKAAARRSPAARRSRSASGSSQIQQLRATVKQLRKRIEEEARARRLDSRLIAEARRARDQLTKQVTALRDQGKKLAEQLRGILTDSKKREKARQDALAVVAELREELARRTEELRQKTLELKDLARESADRAREIIQRDVSSPPSQPEPPKPAEDESGTAA